MQTAFYILAIILAAGLLLGAIVLVMIAQRQSLADDSHLSRRRMLVGECRRCGYNLNKNASGVCPECGTPIIEDPDLLVPGRLTCCLCGKLLDCEDREGTGKRDGVLTTPSADLPQSEPMYKYVNVLMHRGCWNSWMHRDRFVEVVNNTPNSGWRIDQQGRVTPVDTTVSGGTAAGWVHHE